MNTVEGIKLWHEGMKRVLGGTGSSGASGEVHPVTKFVFDFFTEDIRAILDPEAIAVEKAMAVGFTLFKPAKVGDKVIDGIKALDKIGDAVDDVKDTGKVNDKIKNTANTLDEGTVWENIKITQPMYEGTKIPESFELVVDSGKFRVHPNGTKHMIEYITRDATTHGIPINSQTLLSSFQSSIQNAVMEGIKYEEIMNMGNWELIFSKPRGDGLLPVIKYAVYRP